MTIRLPHNYAGNDDASGMNENNPTNNRYYYIRSYKDLLDAMAARAMRKAMSELRKQNMMTKEKKNL